MTKPTSDPPAALRKATEQYRHEKQRAADIERAAINQLTTAIRSAYAGGMKKADILRAIDHEWSRTWLDRAVKDQPTE
jgi:flagellar biosynthesis/type III secretory pathway protein FliH